MKKTFLSYLGILIHPLSFIIHTFLVIAALRTCSVLLLRIAGLMSTKSFFTLNLILHLVLLIFGKESHHN
jgi:hypothetical protein